jgi:hypothetical protein
VTEVLPVLAALAGAAAVIVKLPLVLRRSQLSVPARHFVAGVLLLALALPAQVGPVVDRWRFEWARRGVHPLWMRVTAVIPQVAYQQLAEPWHSESPRSHAYRTVVELRDALVLLCQLSTNRLRVAQIARHAVERGRDSGLTGDDLSAVVAASIIRAGLPVWEDGGRPDSGTPADPRSPRRSR